jgi:hypothetical protein
MAPAASSESGRNRLTANTVNITNTASTSNWVMAKGGRLFLRVVAELYASRAVLCHSIPGSVAPTRSLSYK